LGGLFVTVHYVFGLTPDADAVAMRGTSVIWMGRTSGAGAAQFESYGGGVFSISTLLDDDPDPTTIKPKLPVSQDARGLQFDPGDGSLLFTLAAPADVTVTIFDAAGRLVATPHEGELAAGEHRIAWGLRGSDGEPLRATGIYFVRMKAGDAVARGKVLVLR
jgi:hypothetical protein